jgi:hypothetical protein
MMTVPATSQATKYAGEFMSIGGGARPLGMGGAFVAVANDVSTVYYNPAGISGIEKRQLLGMHSERFGDLVNYNFGAYSQPSKLLDSKWEPAFGLGLIHLGVDDIIITNQLGFDDANGNGVLDQGESLTDENGNPFSAYESLPRETDNSFALMGSFAVKTGYGRVGGTLKILYSDNVAGNTSTGIGIDLGYLYRGLYFDHFDVGVKLQDATGTYISWSTGTNVFISPVPKVGAAYTLKSDKFNGSLLLAADAAIYFDDPRTSAQYWVDGMGTDLHLGAELEFQEKVMVRGGLDAKNPTAGAGLRLGFLGFDYAYLHHDDFDATHRVSVQAQF